jgi:GNAT superfamily N-acetyltransferase
MADSQPQSPNNIADIQRDDPDLEPPQLIAGYEAGPGLLRVAVAGLTGEQLRLRPVVGKWSTLEAVCHVCDSEQFFADRIKRTLTLNRPLLLGADPQTYPEAARYHDRDIHEELALVELNRRQIARILRVVSDKSWRRTAVHSEGGLVTLRQLILHATRHLEHHVTFIEEKRRAIAAGLRGKTTKAIVSSDTHEVGRQGDFLISTDPTLLDLPLIHDFLANRSYWATGRPLEIVRRSLVNSLCFGLYDKGRQVGLARVVTDRATFAWLCDVFVLESYRGRGLSKWLIESVVAHPALQGLRRILLGTRDAHGLYQRYGFTPLADPTRFLEIFPTALDQATQP